MYKVPNIYFGKENIVSSFKLDPHISHFKRGESNYEQLWEQVRVHLNIPEELKDVSHLSDEEINKLRNKYPLYNASNVGLNKKTYRQLKAKEGKWVARSISYWKMLTKNRQATAIGMHDLNMAPVEISDDFAEDGMVYLRTNKNVNDTETSSD